MRRASVCAWVWDIILSCCHPDIFILQPLTVRRAEHIATSARQRRFITAPLCRLIARLLPVLFSFCGRIRSGQELLARRDASLGLRRVRPPPAVRRPQQVFQYGSPPLREKPAISGVVMSRVGMKMWPKPLCSANTL